MSKQFLPQDKGPYLIRKIMNRLIDEQNAIHKVVGLELEIAAAE